jgi:hypothetical protein
MIGIYVSRGILQRDIATQKAIDCLRKAGLAAHADVRKGGGLWLHNVSQLATALDVLRAGGFMIQDRLSFLQPEASFERTFCKIKERKALRFLLLRSIALGT